MNKCLEEKMLAYIDALEKTNGQLVIALKQCLELLAHIKQATPDPNKWQGMLDEIQRIVKVGESVYSEKTFH